MMLDHKLADEPGRLAALDRYEVMDSGPEKPFDKITQLVQDVFQVPMAAVTLLDAERQWFKSIQGLDACQTPRDVAFCDHTIRGREAMVIADATADPRFADNPLVTGPPHIRSYAGVPLETPDGYNLGALCAIDVSPRNFDDSQIAMLGNFAKLVVDELELRRMAWADPLTGCRSRRGWIEAVNQELERCRRYGRDASMVLIDIDHFKQVNDTYGHPAGDTVLKEVVDLCVSSSRESDVFGRIGGEEFAVFLPETGAADAARQAERLRKAIEGRAVEVDGQPLSVTISLGVGAMPETSVTPEQWLESVDKALYAAKEAGRNCWRFAKADQVEAAL